MYERIKELCKQNKITITALERELGFAKGSICKMDSHKPSYGRIKKIADRFNVAVEYITGEAEITWDKESQKIDVSYYLSEEETQLLFEYRNADSTQKEMIRRILAYSDKMSKGE